MGPPAQDEPHREPGPGIGVEDALAQHWSSLFAPTGTGIPVLPGGDRRTAWDQCGFPLREVVQAVLHWRSAGALTLLTPADPHALTEISIETARIQWHPPPTGTPSQPSRQDATGPGHEPRGGADASAPQAGTHVAAPDTPRRALVLFDLFAGTTLAREAMDELLAMVEPRGRLISSYFVELDPHLSAAASTHWARQASDAGRTPHRLLVSDIWDLFRRAPDAEDPRDTPLARAVMDLPRDALVLLSAGTPCNELSSASRLKGRLGLLGNRSKHFWAVPLLAWYIRCLRSDLVVHVLLENVDSMLPEHRSTLVRALALDPRVHVTVLDARTWGPLPRRRIWAATFPIPSTNSDTLHWHRQAPNWEPGWRLNPRGEAPLSTRSRGEWNDSPLPSTFYLHPKNLLYKSSPNMPWDLMSPEDACRQMQRLVDHPSVLAHYPGAKSGLDAILRGRDREPEWEPDAVDFGRWLLDQGRAIGARPLTADERADATGYGLFFRDQGLTGRLLYDAVGMHFDPRSFQRRCFPLIKAWHEDRVPAPPNPLRPDALAGEARVLRETVARLCPTEEIPMSPFPEDVVANLRLAGIWPQDTPPQARP